MKKFYLLSALFALLTIGCQKDADTKVVAGGTLDWTVYDNGTLEIGGTGDMEAVNGAQSQYPWSSYASEIKKVIIDDGVTSIGDAAFSGFSALTSVMLPKGLKSIGVSAFSGCSSLTDITLPQGLTTVKESAFAACSSLKSIALPQSLTSLEEMAFDDCLSLTDITLPDDLTRIELGTFGGCRSLTNITLPESLTNIEVSAFEGCTALARVICPATTPPAFSVAVPAPSTNCFEATGDTLYVPVGSVDAYKANAVWGEAFATIVAIP